jgi:hypothetical protein
MTPLSFEWIWNVEYIIFFGLLYTALIIVGACVGIALFKTIIQLLGFVRDRHF